MSISRKGVKFSEEHKAKLRILKSEETFCDKGVV